MKHSGIILCFFLAACSLAPEAVIPQSRVTEGWRAGEAIDTPSTLQWEDFGSAELDQLITQALAHNTDIAQALARVAQARAATRIAGAGLYPSVDASGSASRSRNERGGQHSYDSSQRAGLSVAYEVDLWQKNANLRDASLWNLQATQYDRDALALTVASEVARLYSGVLAFDARINVAEQNLANAREVLRITDLRFNAGSVSGLEPAQQRTSVASTEAAIASLRNQRTLFFNQLAQLTGVAPATFALSPEARLGDLRLIEPRIAKPWDVLARRPDIAAAEARLRAANIDIGVARANALPGLSLGLDAALFASPAGSAVSLASSFFAPLFAGGALEGAIERSEAVRDEQVAAYEGALLTAMREVEDALSSYDAATRRRDALERGVTEARTAYRIARARFDAGSIDFTTLLDTQAALLSSEDSLYSATQEQLAAATDLMRALGGGWSRPQ